MSKKKAMSVSNIKQLRDNLLESMKDLREGNIELKDALAQAAMTSSVISTIKTEMDYCKLTDQTPHIDFLESSMAITGEKQALLGHHIEEDENEEYQ